MAESSTRRPALVRRRGPLRPLWSDAILEELTFHEALKLEQRGSSSAEATRLAGHLAHEMRRHFDDSCVAGWQPLVGSFGLPDPDDEHVVAAAVVGGAGVIVTDNTRDIRPELVPAGIQVVTAAQFAADTVSVAPDAALRALHEICRRRQSPPLSVADALDALVNRYDWQEAVALLRESA